MSFVLFECVIAAAALLALAELVSWWAVAVLPVAVAVMVKLNDLVSGAMSGPATRPLRARRDHTNPPLDAVEPVNGRMEAVGARSSQVYMSGTYTAGRQADRTGTMPQVVDAPPARVERRLDEAARRAGLDGRATTGSRPAGRTAGSRRQTASKTQSARVGQAALVGQADSGTPREVGRPEWHRTVTLGRHAWRDAGGDDLAEARHRAGPANQRRFA